FVDPSREEIVSDSDCRSLQQPIDSTELQLAIRRLKNGCVAGPDDIPAKQLTYGAYAIAQPLVELINQRFATGQYIRRGAGLRICLF
ncbi:RxLR effector protein, partial [Phytophthora megakarya]